MAVLIANYRLHASLSLLPAMELGVVVPMTVHGCSDGHDARGACNASQIGGGHGCDGRNGFPASDDSLA